MQMTKLPMPSDADANVSQRDLLRAATDVVCYGIVGVSFWASMRYGVGQRLQQGVKDGLAAYGEHLAAGLRDFGSGTTSGAAHLEKGLIAIAEAIKHNKEK